MTRTSLTRFSRGIVVLVVGLLLLSVIPGVVAAETRSGGMVTVGPGETVNDDLDAFGGTIIISGTVNGDVSAFGGDIRIDGEVTGNVNAFGGNVWITGTVNGDVEAASGNVYVQPGAEIGGSLSAAAGNILIAGTVQGNAEVAGGTVRLAETASVGGNVEYAVGEDGQFTNEGATVGGTISRSEDIEPGPWQGPDIAGWIFSVYFFLVNFVLGAVLLLVFPGFSLDIVDRVTNSPLRTGGIGLLFLIGIPILLLLLIVTIVGIPFAIAGGILYGIFLWVSIIYGRFAVGMWILSLVEMSNRWLGLLVGLIVLGLVSRIPWIGGFADFIVLLLGLGAVLGLIYSNYRGRPTT